MVPDEHRMKEKDRRIDHLKQAIDSTVFIIVRSDPQSEVSDASQRLKPFRKGLPMSMPLYPEACSIFVRIQLLSSPIFSDS